MIPPKKCAPCPVCGKEPGMIMTSIGGEGTRYVIRCDSYLSNDRTRPGEHYISTDRMMSPEDAADQWNTLYGGKEQEREWEKEPELAPCPDCGRKPVCMHIAGSERGHRYICSDRMGRKPHRNEGGTGRTVAEAAELWNAKYRRNEE